MFPYSGTVDGITEVLSSNRVKLEKALKETIGDDYFFRIRKAEENLLNENSFTNPAMIDLGNSSEIFLDMSVFCCDYAPEVHPEFDIYGGFKLPPTKISPFFCFSQRGINAKKKDYGRLKPWISPYLAEYVHEYCHFVFFAIKKMPAEMIINILGADLDITFPPTKEDFQRITTCTPETRRSAFLKLYRVCWLLSLYEQNEINARKLEKEIFERMGYTVKDKFHPHYPKTPLQDMRMIVPGTNMSIDLKLGDRYCDFSLISRLKFLENFTENYLPRHDIEENFMESLKKIEMTKTPIDLTIPN